MGIMTFTSDLALRRIEMIQCLLRQQDMTVHELAAGIHMSKRWAQSYLTYLHGLGLVHIAEYRQALRSNGSYLYVPLYAWGEATDAPKPARLSDAERQRRYMQNPEHAEFRAARKRAWAWKPRRDWTAQWIPTQETR